MLNLKILETVFDEEEVSIALADQLGNFLQYIGGPDHVASLLPPLEHLGSAEDSSVRDKTVESLRKLSLEHSDAALNEKFIPMILRLTNADWFTSKCTGSALIDIAYKRATSDQKLMLQTQDF